MNLRKIEEKRLFEKLSDLVGRRILHLRSEAGGSWTQNEIMQAYGISPPRQSELTGRLADKNLDKTISKHDFIVCLGRKLLSIKEILASKMLTQKEKDHLIDNFSLHEDDKLVETIKISKDMKLDPTETLDLANQLVERGENPIAILKNHLKQKIQL